MALHELATNAAKYGAFANASGRLDVTWELPQTGGVQLAIEWREIGGPPVELHARQGFGTQSIRSVVERQLQGTLALMREPNGLRCSISLPMQNISPK